MPNNLQQLEIHLDNPQGIYFAGQNINGVVFISLNEPMKLRGVRLQLSGRAYVHWTESHGTGNQRRTDTYSSSEAYLNQEVVLWGAPSSASSDSSLPAGTHQFAFQFILPPNCPTSFEGAHGHIRYFMKAVMDRPWKFDHTFKRVFTVISHYDLNAFPQMAVGVEVSGSKELGCLCCAAGPISATIRIPKQGYVPGEVIFVDADVRNTSTRDLDRLMFKLVQVASFTASHGWSRKTRTASRVVGEIRQDEDVKAGQTQLWHAKEFRIPAIPPALVNCGIISVTYHLQFDVDPYGMSTDLTLRLPMIIGTIPLRQNFAQFQPPGYGFNQPGVLPSASSSNGIPQTPPPPQFQSLYPDCPPPSYQDCVTGKSSIREADDNDHTKGQMDYAPMYPVYGFGSGALPSAPPVQDANVNKM